MNRAAGGDDLILSLKGMVAVFFRRFWIIAATVIITVGLAMLLSFLQTPQYEASVRMLVGQDQGITDSPTEAVGLQQLTQTMAVAADSRPVAQAVIDELNLDLTTEEFFENLSVEQVSSTQFIEISYTSPDPQEAQRIADATGEAFSQQISEVSDGSAPITAVLYESAELPDEPVVPDFFRNGAISFVLGLMLGAGLAFLMEMIDDRWNSPEEAESLLNLPVFGVIPSFEAASGESLQNLKKTLEESRSTTSGDEEVPETVPAAAAVRLEDSPSTNGSDPDHERGGVQLLPARGEGAVWPVGMLLLDPEGRVEEADETFLTMLGCESSEVVGEEFASLLSHPDDAQSHGSLHEELSGGKRSSYSVEKRLVGKDGQIRWIEATVSGLRGGSANRSAMAMVEDITRLKQAEEEANISSEAKKLSEERLRAVMGNSPIKVSFFTPDGYSLSEDDSWNDLWHDLWYEPGETNGESVLDNERIKNVGLDRYFRESIDSGSETVTPPLKLEKTVGENGSSSSEERWLRAFIHPVADGRGGVREVMMMLEDLTQSKSDEAALREEGSESLREIQNRLTEREMLLNETRKSLQKSEAERQEISAKLEEARGGIQTSDERSAKLDAELKRAEEIRLRLQDSLRQSEENNEQNKAERSRLEEAVFEKEESLQQAESGLRQSEESRAEAEKSREVAEASRAEAEKSREEAEGDLKRVREELAANEAEKKELQASIEASESEKREVERRLSQIQEKLGAILAS